MNKLQVMESLSKILNKIHFAMEEIDDVVDNDLPKSAAQKYLINASMQVTELMDKLNDDVYLEGTKSGAV